jgi:hypothetical protein
MNQVFTTAYNKQILLSGTFLSLLLLPNTTRAQTGPPAVPPPTTQQAPLPDPALPLPRADHPLLASPGVLALSGLSLSQPLTIKQVVSIALATNRTLALEVEAYQEAQGTTITARAGLGPTASTTYTFTRYNEQIGSTFGGQTIITQQQYVNQLTAAFSVPIDITGELRAAASQAKFQEIAARLEINRVRNQIVLDTKTAFYTVLRDQALVKVAQDSLQNSVAPRSRYGDALRYHHGAHERRQCRVDADQSPQHPESGVLRPEQHDRHRHSYVAAGHDAGCGRGSGVRDRRSLESCSRRQTFAASGERPEDAAGPTAGRQGRDSGG